MRIPHRKQQYLGCTPVTQVALNPNCRDRMIPILRGLQHIYSRPQLRRRALDLIARMCLGDADPDHGRPGLTLWQIFVLASVRLGCDFTYDHLQDLAENHDNLRHIMQVMARLGRRVLRLPRIRDNICRVRPETIEAINHLIVAEGHRLDPSAGETSTRRFVRGGDEHPLSHGVELDPGRLAEDPRLAPELAESYGCVGLAATQVTVEEGQEGGREIGRTKKTAITHFACKRAMESCCGSRTWCYRGRKNCWTTHCNMCRRSRTGLATDEALFCWKNWFIGMLRPRMFAAPRRRRVMEDETGS